jgi:hypothetical protein
MKVEILIEILRDQFEDLKNEKEVFKHSFGERYAYRCMASMFARSVRAVTLSLPKDNEYYATAVELFNEVSEYHKTLVITSELPEA